jgi:protein O-GlcNAc transferase
MTRQNKNKEARGEDRSCSIYDLFQEALLLHRKGMVQEAKRIYMQIIRINPEDPDALQMMGIASFQSREISTAEDLLIKAVQLSPDRADIRCSLANIMKFSGKIDEAIEMYKEAIRLDPEYAEACNNLGATMNDAGRYDEAIDYLIQALKIRPDYAEAFYNLGNTYKERDEIDKAIDNYNQAIKNNYPDAYINLGVILMEIGNEVDAIKYFKEAIKLKPDSTVAYNNLGSAFTSQGNLKEAVLCYKKCLEINPKLHKTHSNLLLALHYTNDISAEDLFLEHKKWAADHALPIKITHHYMNERNPDKKIRIGYISPDFRSHPVAHFIESVLTRHDRNSFDLYCYSDTADPDHITDRLKMLTVTWRDICRMNDKEVSDLILSDRIDILIDLAGHTANNRLLVFARKPAPVQATYLGYPDTTGLDSMDYRITDSLTDSPGRTDRLHTEELVRMPHGFLCYRPPEHIPGPGPLPVLKSGRITFGCFNKRAKITEEVIETWSAILSSIPDSRLFLKFKNFLSDHEKSNISALFNKNSISSDRIHVLKPIQSLAEHISMYSNIDIALDTFPYNGTTTTCEALWMGVPVITLKGSMHASRVGTSILMNSGLEDLIAESTMDYINKAVQLADNIERLGSLHIRLRDMIRCSHLTNEKEFTTALENKFRMMWQRWCDGHHLSPSNNTSLNETGSTEIEHLINNGEALFNSGHLSEAENTFRKVLEKYPENIAAMNNLGVIFWHYGKISSAVEIFTNILKIDPAFIDARINLEEIGKPEHKHASEKSGM